MDSCDTIWNVAEVIVWIMVATGFVGGGLALWKHLTNNKER